MSRMQKLATCLLLALAMPFFGPSSALAAASKTAAKNVSCAKWLHPADFFTANLDALEEALTSSEDPHEVIEHMMENDSRSLTFNLEGMSRLYEKRDEMFTDLREVFKGIEDHLGKYSLNRELLGDIAAGSFPKEFSAFMEQKGQEDYETLFRFLTGEHWLSSSDSRIETIRETLKNFDFEGAKKERKLVVKAIRKRILKLRERIKGLEKLIFKDQYDYNALEFGLHKFRRDVRWLGIFLQANKALFHVELHEGKASPMEANLIRQYRGKRFTTLSKQTEHTIGIPEIAYYQISEAIDYLGQLKNKGEAQHFLTLNWIEFQKSQGRRLSEKDAHEEVLKMLKATMAEPVEKSAQRYYRLYTSDDPMKKIEKALR